MLELLIARPWPETKEALRNEESEKQFLSLIGVIQSIRKLRADQDRAREEAPCRSVLQKACEAL